MFCEYCKKNEINNFDTKKFFYLYEKSQNERKRVRERDRVIQGQSDSTVLERENVREQSVREGQSEKG